MICYRCNAKCSNGSSRCWKCGKTFGKSKKVYYTKNVHVKKEYNIHKEKSGLGELLALGVATVGGLLYLTQNEEFKK